MSTKKTCDCCKEEFQPWDYQQISIIVDRSWGTNTTLVVAVKGSMGIDMCHKCQLEILKAIERCQSGDAYFYQVPRKNEHTKKAVS